MIADETCIACPTCDVLHRVAPDIRDQRTQCVRCGFRLSLGWSDAIARVVAAAFTSVILTWVVLFGPFLRLEAGSFQSEASVIDVVKGFSEGIMAPLALAVFVLIAILPMIRALFLLYALVPVFFGKARFHGAEAALRWAFRLKPWAMSEIFMVGVAVALVKLAGMARIEMGLAFWAFAALVIVNAFQNNFMCRNTLWTAISTSAR